MIKLFRITTYPISLQKLLRGQPRFFSDHFEFVAISNPGPELAEIQEREAVRTIGIPMTRQITPFHDLLSLIRMIGLFLKEKPDIVHTHTPKAGIIGMIAAWLTCRPKRLHTVAGLPLMATQGLKKQILISIEKLTYACATTVIPNSQGLHSYLIDNQLCDPQKLLFLEPGSSNGIDLEYFSRDAIQIEMIETKKTLRLDDSHFIFIFAGRITRDKGINELAEAFFRLADKNTQIRLLLVGDFDHGLNPIKNNIKILLMKHPQIIRTGFQPDIRPYLAVADILILPSYREGLPQIVLQACAMDTPCIVSDIMGCNEIIGSENGQRIMPRSTESLYQAMYQAITNPDQVKKWKAHARTSIIRYDQTLVWKKLLNVYTDK
jgi:glycosyltransferase involved in cell wall biosynthesis